MPTPLHVRKCFAPFVVSFATLSILTAGTVSAENWPMFRGPDGSGTSTDESLPVKWTADENLLWSTDLPGPGSSSPIVWNDRVFVTCYSGYGVDPEDAGDPSELKRHLLCMDRRSGKLIWQATVDASSQEDPYKGFITDHGYSSSTPTTDGERIFSFFGKDGVHAFDWDGKELWHSNVGTQSDPARWGGGSSPVLFEDLVIVNAGNEGSAVVALHKNDGSEAWRLDEPNCKNSWSTPVLIEVDGHAELVFSVPSKIFALNPKLGDVLWTCESPMDSTVVPSSVAVGDIILSMGSRAGEAIAVRCGGTGDVTDSHVVWRQKLRAGICTPVALGDQIYWSSMGTMLSADIKSGKADLKERLDSPASPKSENTGFMNRPGSVYASPIAAGNRIYLLTRSGAMHVFDVKPEFKQIAVNTLADDNGPFDGTPAVSDGQIFFRSVNKLYCVQGH